MGALAHAICQPTHVAVLACAEEIGQSLARLRPQMSGRETNGIEAEAQGVVANGLARRPSGVGGSTRQALAHLFNG